VSAQCTTRTSPNPISISNAPALPGARLADFAREAVRDLRFVLIEETLQNYPVDGFELNLNHYAGGHFFHPDQVETGRAIMTDWIHRVYAAEMRTMRRPSRWPRCAR
jgi:hypothetical protein